MEKLNAELCNTLGNLLNRVVGKNLNPQQHFPIPSVEAFRQFENSHLQSLVDSLISLPTNVDDYFSSLRIDRGVDSIMAVLRQANQLLHSARPWKMDAETEADQIKVVLYSTMETIRVCGILLQPIVPNLAGKMLDVINVDKNHRSWIELFDNRRPFHRVTPNENSEMFTLSLGDIPLRIAAHQLPLYPRLRL